MSKSTCFLYDICNLKVQDMECMDIAKTEEGLEPHDEHQKVEKLKESHLLLKKKLSLSHELIKQYNDKMKECQQVTEELETVKDNLRKISSKHTSSVLKITKLEIENEDYRQKIENYSKIVPEQETKIAADKQHLQQLICKVQELERKEIIAVKSKKEDFWKEKVRTLETELKSAKESHKLEIKQMEMKLFKSMKVAEVVKNQTKKKEMKITQEKATCTGNELEIISIKPQTAERCTMTNEFYSIKDDPYPLFCSKCLVKLDPVPLDQILTQMSACPKLITEVPSPRKESEIKKLNTSPRILRQRESPELEMTANDSNNFRQSSDSTERNSDVSKSDFRRLERKILLLERKLHKKIKKEDKQGGNSCCGFQHPNNCYLGPYTNLFQPGAMIRTQPEMFQFQNWQEGLRNRKRSRQISIQKSNRRGIKLRKKRKLDDGTSEWNIDSVPIRESVESDNSNVLPDDIESLRTESPSPNFSNSKTKSTKRRKVKESGPPITQRKRNQLSTLFSPARSPSPILHDNTDEQVHNETRNESTSDGEIIENGSKTPEDSIEHETIEYVPRKRGRPPKNAVKTVTKRSLVTKIRNLKKNCNTIKPLAGKTVPANNNTKKLIGNSTSGATVPVIELRNTIKSIPQNKTDQISNNVDDYCPAKKYRIAHSARKSENESLCKGTKNPLEITKASFQNESVNVEVAIDTQREDSATIEKLDSRKDKIENTKCVKNTKSIVRIEREESSRDSADTDSSHVVEKSLAVKSLEIESVGEFEPSETETMNTSISVVDKISNDKVVVPLQPCIMIPKIYLEIEGVENPCTEIPCSETNETEEEEESAASECSTIDRISSNNAPLRILRSKTKMVKSTDKISSKNDGEDVINKNPTLSHPEEISRTMKVELIRCSSNIHPQEFADNDTSDVHDTSIKSTDKSEEANNEILQNYKAVPPPPAIATRKYKRRTRIEVSSVSPMRELRSRSIMLSSSMDLGENDCPTKDENMELRKDKSGEITQPSANFISRFNNRLGPKALIEQLLQNKNNSHRQYFHRRKRMNPKLQERKENLVLKELSNLCEDVEWSSGVLADVIERLSKFKIHTIAKCTIDFLVTRAEDNEELDRTHTPPAPLLTKTQQRVLTMLVVLNRKMPNIIQIVQAGIEFRLFRLGYAPEVNVIEELARVFTALARIQKDRERVRILCCDALYCLGLKAMCLIYVILISWPEVFPMAGSSSDPLVLCLIDSIMTQTGDTSFPKFFALKKLLKGYYNYENSGYVSKTLAKDFLNVLREKRQNGLDTAIILLAKKKGPDWTYENFIQGGLLQMIIQNAHPSIYDAFCLLGHLMRTFPIEDKNGLVKNILEQLCALMESGEGSMQRQEGVATALLSLFRHGKIVVAKAIMNWKPSEPLSESTSKQLIGLFDSQGSNWWHKFLRRNDSIE